MDELMDEDFRNATSIFWKAYFELTEELGFTIEKDTANDFKKSKYAHISTCLAKSRPALLKHGFRLVQIPLGGMENFRLSNTLIHKSGESIKWLYVSPLAEKNSQGVGSCTTYARRYSHNAVLGFAEVDDDGEAASHTDHPKERQNNQNQTVTVPEANKGIDDGFYIPPIKKNLRDSPLSTAPKGPSPAQLKRLYAITKSAGYSAEEIKAFVKTKWGLNSFENLDWRQYKELCGDESKGVLGLIPGKSINTAVPANDNGYAGDNIPF